ncbi:MAG: transglycosylase SLT domain-containing protein [Nitrospinae bacterium]|nr:transglycosylase SLT domain-containing protein [Nitrospinota bacterium]
MNYPTNLKFLLLLVLFFFPLTVASETGAGNSGFQKASEAIRSGEFQSALALLEKFPADTKGLERDRVLFLTGLSLMGLKKYEEAKASFKEIPADYPLQDYVEWNLLLCDYNSGNHPGVIQGASRFFSSQPNSRLLPGVRSLQVKSHIAIKEWDKALEILKPLLKTGEKDTDAPEAFQLYHEVLLEQKKILDAYKTLQDLYCYFPNSPEGARSREKMKPIEEKKGLSLPPLDIIKLFTRWTRLMDQGGYETVIQESDGMVSDPKLPKGLHEKLLMLRGNALRHLKDYSQALDTYKEYPRKYPNGPDAPESLYWTAYINWNIGKLDEAEDVYGQIKKKFPKSEWTVPARFVIAGVMENRKDFDKALAYYQEILEIATDEQHVEKAAWKIAWIHYQMKEYDKSLDRFKKAVGKFPPFEKEKALFWAARCAERLNKPEETSGLLEDLFKTHYHGFYMFLGREVFGGKKNADPLKIEPAGVAADTQPDSFAFQEFKKPGLSTSAAFHLDRAVELTEAALSDDALKEFRDVYKEIDKKKLDELMWLGQLYYQAGAYAQLISMMNSFLLTASPNERTGLPDLFWRLYYPPAYLDVVAKASARHGVDPFLVLGLMRQESSFDRKSLSSAGAMGLMQLMPHTGEKVFKKVYNAGTFSKAMLYDTELNIELGVSHLAELIQENGGNIVDVLAGYNAGMSKAADWKKRFQEYTGEEFIEMISYGETRNYIKKVLRNYYNYKRLYGKGNSG